MKSRTVLTLFGASASSLLAPSTATTAGAATSICVSPPKSPNVKVKVSPVSVKVGQKISFRVQDSGARGVKFGYEFDVERCVEGNWALASFSPREPWPEVGLALRSGGSGPWEQLEIPPTATAGEYRVSENIGGHGRRRPYFGLFHIIGPQA